MAFRERDVLRKAVHDAVLLSEETTCKSPRYLHAAIGSRRACQPYTASNCHSACNLYYPIVAILRALCAPSRAMFAQGHLGLCYESMSSSAVSSRHGHTAANR